MYRIRTKREMMFNQEFTDRPVFSGTNERRNKIYTRALCVCALMASHRDTINNHSLSYTFPELQQVHSHIERRYWNEQKTTL